MAEEKERFEAMLAAINQGTDNNMRKQAEASYNQVRDSNPSWTASALTEVAATSTDVAVSNTALVLLRKLYGKEGTAYESSDAETQKTLKSRLLEIFGTTPQNLIRRAAAACIANLAVKLSMGGKNDWPELWIQLLSAVEDSTLPASLRAASVYVFAQVATFLSTTYFATHLEKLATAFCSCLADPSTELKQNTAEAIANMVAVMSDPKQIHDMQRTIPSIFSAVDSCCRDGEYEAATQILKHFCDCIEQTPEFLKHHVSTLLNNVMIIAKNGTIDTKTRQMALEIVLTFGDLRPKSIRKVKGFATEFFNLMFQYLHNPPMESDWATTYDDTDDAQDNDFETGATSMDRLARIVEGKGMQEIATTVIMQNIGHAEWRNRVAALTTLTYLFEGCKEEFKPNLGSIFGLVQQQIDHEHPMVRHCAIQCIAQMCRDFAPEFQQFYAGTVLPLICQKLSDPIPRLQALAAASLNTFLQDVVEDDAEDDDEDDADEEGLRPCRRDYMVPFITPLVESLVGCLQTAPVSFIQEQCLLTLSTLIGIAQKEILPHVPSLVPMFQNVLAMEETTPEIRKLKCRAIECTTLIASNVGKKYFAAWAHPVCQYLMSTLDSGLSTDDPRLRYVLRGWTCMVECLKEEVLPYMDSVMPRLLAVANIECDVEEVETDAGEEAAKSESDNIKVIKICSPGVSEKTVRLNTGLIEDKDLAITIIMTIILNLKGHAAKYLPDVTSTAVKLLGFSAYEEIRETAASTIGYCGQAYKESQPDALPAFLEFVMKPLIEAAQEETEVEVCTEMIDTIGMVLECAPKGCLATESMTLTAKILYELFDENFKRMDALHDADANRGPSNEEDSDEEDDDLQDEKDNEEFMLSTTSNCVGKLIKTTPAFIPLFETTFLPFVQNLLGPDRKAHHHKFGLCLLSDFAEHGAEHAIPHAQLLVQAFSHFSTNDGDDAGVKQAAIFGGGELVVSMAKYIPQPEPNCVAFAKYLSQCCGSFLADPKAKEEDWISVADNCVSALLKCVEHFGAHGVDGNACMQAAILNLPIKDDPDEGFHVHDKLVDWAAIPNHPVLSNPTIRAQVFAALKDTKFLSPEAKAKLASLQ